MATEPTTKLLTYEDYCRLPDDRRWEVIHGEAVEMPGANTRHQELTGTLYYRVRRHLEDFGGGRVFIPPYDVLLGPHEIFQPDIVFVADDRTSVILPLHISGVPTWVIEVVSESRRDRRLKRDAYETAEVPEYWIVDPDADRVEVFRLEAGRYPPPFVAEPPGTLAASSLPGFELDLPGFFAR